MIYSAHMTSSMSTVASIRKCILQWLRLLHCFFQLIIPDEAPIAEDVDFDRLAHSEMTGGNIKSAVFRAASRAALREEGE